MSADYTIDYDEGAEASYIHLRDEPVARTVEVEETYAGFMLIDLGADGHPVGVEILSPLPKPVVELFAKTLSATLVDPDHPLNRQLEKKRKEGWA